MKPRARPPSFVPPVIEAVVTIQGGERVLLRYIRRRLLMTVPILFAVSVLVFMMVHLMPGDPARIIAGDSATEEDVEMIRKEMGLDKPLVQQYLTYVSNIFKGDLGMSMRTRRPVAVEISSRLPNTVRLAAVAMVISVIFGVAVGVISASRPYSLSDNLSMVGALVGVSMPTFYLGLMLMLLFSVKMGWVPLLADGSLKGMILPAVTLAARPLALLARMTRSSMLEVLNQDYILAARAQGLPERVVLYSRALKNCMTTILTVAGLQFGHLLAGAVVTEQVFAWPGIGSLIVVSIRARDFPTIQACVLLIAVSFVLLNLLTDILYSVVNPRVRLG